MSDYKRISIEQTQQLIDSKPVVLVDVRDAQSYQAGHIDGAISLDNSNIEQFLQSTEKNATIIVYCYHGNSSQQVAQYLCEQGYKDVSSMDRGFEDWRLK